jgi:hypothetical protein
MIFAASGLADATRGETVAPYRFHDIAVRAVGVALALALFLPGSARAQWSERPTLLSLPSGEERWGISAGSFRFWPRLSTQGRYDSNLFRADVSEGPHRAAILGILPGLTLVNPKPRLFRLYLDVAGDIRVYFGDEAAVTEQTDAGATLNFALDLFPRGPVTVRLFDRFTRALQTRNWATAGTFTRNFNLAGVQGIFKPGGGALELGLEYAFAIDLFDEFSRGDQRYHDFGARVSWKFYPLTSVFLDVDFKIVTYEERVLSADFGLTNTDSLPLRAVLGLNGHITKRLAVLVQAGWAEGFYDDGPSFGGVIGLARVSYRVARGTLLQLGYARDYEDSLHGNYFAEHRIFFSGQQQLWERLDIRVTASYHFLDYSAFEPPKDPDTGEPERYGVSQRERAEQALRLAVSARVDVTRWLAFDLGYSYEALFSDYTIVDVQLGKVAQVFTYYRHQVYAGITGRY